MKIIKLTAENIKRLVAIEIEPSGSVVRITGKNGAGKTSVLDSIWWALGGSRNIPRAPIREGQDFASVTLELDEDLIVKRTFTRAKGGSSYLTVETRDGAIMRSPQQVLDRLIDLRSFDPLAFIRANSADQLQVIRSITGIDTTAMDEEIARAREHRTVVGREAKAASATAEAMRADAPEEDPGEKSDIGALRRDVESAQRVKAHNEACARRLEQATHHHQQCLRQVQALEDQLAGAREALGVASDEMQRAEVDAHDQPEDGLDEALARLAGASEHDERVEAWRRAETATFAAQQARQAHERAQQAVLEVEAQRRALIESAEMPIEGLAMTGEGVTYAGLPIEQASHAEQLRIGLAVAMAVNPKLRIVRITDGSLLDEHSFAAIEAAAGEHDFQVWVEVVGGEGTPGVYIEDGRVRGAGEDQEEGGA